MQHIQLKPKLVYHIIYALEWLFFIRLLERLYVLLVSVALEGLAGLNFFFIRIRRFFVFRPLQD